MERDLDRSAGGTLDFIGGIEEEDTITGVMGGDFKVTDDGVGRQGDEDPEVMSSLVAFKVLLLGSDSDKTL